MKRMLADGWFQVFGIVTLLSLGVHVYDRFGTRSAPAARNAPEPQAAAAAAPQPPQADVVERASSDARIGAPIETPKPPRADAGPVPTQASFPIFRIASKTPGRWVVADQAGPDVDSPSIARAIYSAADGDEILLKPGLYLEPLEITGKSLTLRGLGAHPEEVLVTSPDRTAVLKIDGGSVKLQNLRIEPERGTSEAAAAVLVRSGRLSLVNVTARSQDVAILAEQGRENETSIDADSSLLEGAYADLLVRGQARVALRSVQFSNPRQPIVVWRASKVRVESCRFVRTAQTRLYAYEESSVAVDDSPTAPAVSWRRSAQDADADRLRFPGAEPETVAAAPTKWARNIFQKPGKQN